MQLIPKTHYIDLSTRFAYHEKKPYGAYNICSIFGDNENRKYFWEMNGPPSSIIKLKFSNSVMVPALSLVQTKQYD